MNVVEADVEEQDIGPEPIEESIAAESPIRFCPKRNRCKPRKYGEYVWY
jgi:hypothetical protein